MRIICSGFGEWRREAGHAGTAADPVRKHRSSGGSALPWDCAPIPARLHWCRAQTVELWGETRGRAVVLEARAWCACGGHADPDGTLRAKNSRRAVAAQ